ncbi:MAG TPA: hypothetical protein PLJ21_08205 [Pseudobdellovibrionaceae bacterium]|nr:hypothetical protein [Pseudobdellovibrionaceae bacterium]
MKTKKILALLSALALCPSINAATMNVSTSAMSLNNVQVDFKMDDQSSLAPIIGATRYSSGNDSATGLLVGVSYNRMFSQKIFEDGWSANWNGRYYSVKPSQGDSSTGYSVGVLAQKNWFWQNGFNINAGIGLQYLKLNIATIGLELSGILPDVGFNVGYVF